MVDFYLDLEAGSFVWDSKKAAANVLRHGISFADAAQAFTDPQRFILQDPVHSAREPRYFCIGCVDGKVVTVRFTLRGDKNRIIGAGYWRKWRKLYEKKTSI
jgi:uncharacterized DUF497 family protein